MYFGIKNERQFSRAKVRLWVMDTKRKIPDTPDRSGNEAAVHGAQTHGRARTRSAIQVTRATRKNAILSNELTSNGNNSNDGITRRKHGL